MKQSVCSGILGGFVGVSLLLALSAPALAAQPAPENLLPPTPSPSATPRPVPSPSTAPSPSAAASAPAAVDPVVPVPAPVTTPPVVIPARPWTLADAQALLGVIEKIEHEGLIAADYRPDALRAAIGIGEGTGLDEAAGRSFTWLAEDLRDGRTPMTARLQWFAVDPDQDAMPTDRLMATALETRDVAGVLASLAPAHPDYAALKSALAVTPASDARMRGQIRANMDRWRWLVRELGTIHLITNVPEFQLRLTVNDKIIRSYRTVVGKPGRTATPQLAETVTAVVFNPTWTVPQSIVQGEGLGPRLLANPASARAQGYKVSRGADGFITVVQQPGDSNSLGRMKIDMPNPHAIYLHDTPSKALFNTPVRAYSHGCIRTERAVELGMTMAILGAGLTPEQAAQNNLSGIYTRVTMTRTFPVYITYFTMAKDINGRLTTFNDIYERDGAVLASFERAREMKTAQRASTEEIIKLDNPL